MTEPYTIERTPFDEDYYDKHLREIVSYTVNIAVNESSFLLVSVDPYGLFEFRPVKGPLPDRLKGNFSSIRDARKAIESYISSNPRVHKKAKAAEDSKLPV